MPIASGDVVAYYTTTAGAAGNTTAGTMAGSLGKYMSTTPVAAGTNGLFDDISAAENAASTVDYRAIAVTNNNSTITAFNVGVYLSAEVAGGASIAIAIDNIAASAKGGASAQGAQIASETTAPTGVGAFSSPTTSGTALSIGTLAPNTTRIVWVRRTAANTAAVDADGVTLGFYFE